MSQFAFLKPEWPDLHEAAARAEALALSDPRAATFYARRALELATAWLYKADRRLKLPYQDNLSALLHEPSFRATTGDAIFHKTRYLKDAGNKAVHSDKPVSEAEARAAVGELFHLGYWLARTYARDAKPDAGLAFDPARLPRPMAVIAKLTLDQLRRREEDLPAEARDYLAAISDHLHTPIRLVGVGPGRDQVIWMGRKAEPRLRAAA